MLGFKLHRKTKKPIILKPIPSLSPFSVFLISHPPNGENFCGWFQVSYAADATADTADVSDVADISDYADDSYVLMKMMMIMMMMMMMMMMTMTMMMLADATNQVPAQPLPMSWKRLS